jgi:bifunctional DNase/RNase
VGTVKARVHRARARLRQALSDAIGTAATGPGRSEEDAMIEVSVEDVMVRAPSAEPAMWLAMPKDNKLGLMRVVLLKERQGDRVLPIWLWPVDGDAIAMRLVDLTFFRPGPHDLIARLLDIGDLRVERVAVTGLREDTYYGSLWVRAAGTLHEIDVRPSDAITIALDTGAPILVTEETFAQARRFVIRAGDELSGLTAIHARSIAEGKAEPDDKEYRSFRSLPRNEGKWVRARPRRA